MPKRDGLSLLKAIRSSDVAAQSDVPVILLTSEDHTEFEDEARREGATAFLHKPVSDAGLLDVVTRVLPPSLAEGVVQV
jgi:two-component system chemotaxis response regulator CheY